MKPANSWTAALFVLALGSALPAAALATAEDPVNREARLFLASLGERTLDVARDTTSPRREREARIRALLREGFDLKVLARFVLGKHWRQIDRVQRAEFVDVFEDAMVQQTLTMFGRYTGESFDITAVGADRTNPRLIAIAVNVLQPDGSLLARVNWRIRQSGGKFKVVDVVVEGVSIALTLRQEYRAVIERSEGKVAGLIEELRRSVAWKQESAEAGRDAAAP